MFNRKSVLIAGVAAVLALASTVSSHAVAFGPITQLNHVTFSQPVSLPGVTLAAGTYDFEVFPERTHPDIVRVTSRGGRQTYYMGFTREVARPRGLPIDRVVVFGEAEPGAVTPIAAWYPLNAASGHAFVYR